MQCIDIVTEYGPELIKLMDGAINPQELCKVSCSKSIIDKVLVLSQYKKLHKCICMQCKLALTCYIELVPFLLFIGH